MEPIINVPVAALALCFVGGLFAVSFLVAVCERFRGPQ